MWFARVRALGCYNKLVVVVLNQVGRAWPDAVRMCVNSHMQPVLLFYVPQAAGAKLPSGRE